MDEIGVDRRQPGIGLAGIHQHLAHADERGGAARRVVQAADEFLAAGLGRPLQARQRLGVGGRAPGVDGGLDGLHVGAEMAGERLQEDQPGLVVGGLEFGKQTRGQRQARSLAAARQKLLAEIDQAEPPWAPSRPGPLVRKSARPRAEIASSSSERSAERAPAAASSCCPPLPRLSPLYMWLRGAKRQAAARSCRLDWTRRPGNVAADDSAAGREYP